MVRRRVEVDHSIYEDSLLAELHHAWAPKLCSYIHEYDNRISDPDRFHSAKKGFLDALREAAVNPELKDYPLPDGSIFDRAVLEEVIGLIEQTEWTNLNQLIQLNEALKRYQLNDPDEDYDI